MQEKTIQSLRNAMVAINLVPKEISKSSRRIIKAEFVAAF